jgi:hypothetical protein
MEKLGRKPVYRSLIVLTSCAVTTMPETNAPVITPVLAGKELKAYDNHNGYWLVLATDESVSQPYLPSGRYHWDGWVNESFVAETPGKNLEKGNR